MYLCKHITTLAPEKQRSITFSPLFSKTKGTAKSIGQNEITFVMRMENTMQKQNKLIENRFATFWFIFGINLSLLKSFIPDFILR